MKALTKAAIRGLASYVPGLTQLALGRTGGTNSARYCYSVWLRHLKMSHINGLNARPRVVAELGPGDSLGIGLAALLSGCEKYYAFDVYRHAQGEANHAILDELITLFESRANIPDADELPLVKPYLDDYSFPHEVLTEARLARALDRARIAQIHESLTATDGPHSLVQYKVPWVAHSAVDRGIVDMIYSQAVLEHVDDLPTAYASMRYWLSPTGHMSHQIDFKAHGTADEWNGHWTYSDLTWRLIRGNRPYLLNRAPRSAHLQHLRDCGFKIVCEKVIRTDSRLTRAQLARRFQQLSEDDLTASGMFIQAVKGP